MCHVYTKGEQDMSGNVDLKKRYLGAPYLGQDLCYCIISVGANAVSVTNVRAGTVRYTRFIEDPDDVELLKTKLRAFLSRMHTAGRWKVHRQSPGVANIVIYYPSRAWASPYRRVHLIGDMGSV
jgi:hypothetical protein